MKTSLNKAATATPTTTTSQHTAINTITLISPDSVEERDFSLVTQTQNPTISQSTDTASTTDKSMPTTTTKDSTQSADTASTTDKSMATTTTKDSTDANTLSGALCKSKVDSSNSGSLPHESSEAIQSSIGVESDVEWLPGLFVFGGMDTSGHIHGDCFILCPQLESSKQ